MRFLAGLVVVCLVAPCAHAKEPSESVRRMGERAFLEGRLDDLGFILASADADSVWAAALREALLWWRSVDGTPVGEPPHPQPDSGGGSDMRLIAALLADRQLRETRGAAGLPEASPLHVLAQSLDERVYREELWYLDDSFRLMRETYHEALELPAGALRRYRDLTLTAKIAALGTLGAFVVLAFFAALLVGRQRTPADRRRA